MKNENRLSWPALPTGGFTPLFACALVLFASAIVGPAANRVWDGSSSGNWATPANWSNNAAVSANDILIFPATGLNKTNNNNFANGTVFSELRLTDDYVLNGNALDLTNGIYLDTPAFSGTATAVINLGVTLNRDQAFTAEGSFAFLSSRLSLRSTLNLNGRILSVEGDGTVELTGPITGTGGITREDGGTLVISNNSAFSGTLNIPSGTVRLAGMLTNVKAFLGTFNGSGASLTGTGGVASFEQVFGGHLSPGFNGPGIIDLGTNAIFFGVGDSVVSIELNGLQPGVGHDQLRVNGPFGAINGPPSPLLQLTLGFAPQLGDTFTIVNNTDSGPPSQGGGAAFVVTQSVSRERQQYEGATFTTNGFSLRLSYRGGDGNDVVLTVIRTPASPVSYWDAGETNNFLNSSNNWVGAVAPTSGHHLHFTTWTTGGGTLATNNLPVGTSFASLNFSGDDFAFGASSNFVLRGNAIALTGGITNSMSPGTNVVEWNIALALTQHVANTTFPLTLAGQLSGNSTFVKEGSGEVILSGGVNNIFFGPTFVNSGTLRLAKTNSARALSGALTIGNGVDPASVIYVGPGQMADGFPITVRNGSLLALSGQTLTVSALTLEGGAVQMGVGELTLAGNLNANAATLISTIAGRLNLFGQVIGFNIANGAPPTDLSVTAVITNGGLNKLGPGTLTLLGNNSYTGPTTVSAGRLLVHGSQPFSAVTVSNGELGGAGTIGTLVVNNGLLSPGTSPGILKVSGNVTLSAAATLVVELNGLIPGTGYDQLSVTGTVDLAGATLSASAGFAATPGNALTLIVNDGTDAIAGTFAGLPQGAVLSIDGQAFAISYTGGTGNDVVLTRVNGPANLSGPLKLVNGQFQFQGMGEVGLSYLVQASTDLSVSNWVSLGSVPADGSGLFQFIDTNAPQIPMRFYRAVSP